MNWTRVLIAGVAAGIATNLADFAMHGVIMANTYKKYTEVFSQTPANPLWFLAVALCLSLSAAVLFAKTRSSWAAGWTGGATFGFFLGLVGFWPGFYQSLTIDGFPVLPQLVLGRDHDDRHRHRGLHPRGPRQTALTTRSGAPRGPAGPAGG